MKNLLALCGWAALAAVTIAFIGCGGGSTPAPARLPVVQTPSPQPPPPTPNPPPPPSPVVPAKHYQVIDLVPLPGANDSQANAISGGHAAGYSVFWSGGVGTARATFWHDGIADDLGSGEASAINNSDQIVGFTQPGRDQGDFTPHATLWDHGSVIDLGLLAGFDSSLATAINDSGEVVGISYTLQNPQNEVGFKWTQQTGMQVVDGAATASGTNTNGDVAGMNQNLRATIFTATGTAIDLGTLGDFSVAGAVNNQDHAVGYSPLVANGPVHAFFYNGTMQDLGTIQAGSNTNATSLNNSDLVVGVSNLNGNALPWVWSSTTGIEGLNGLITDSAWTLLTASGINQDGEIVGAGVVGTGEIHGFLLTPEN